MTQTNVNFLKLLTGVSMAVCGFISPVMAADPWPTRPVQIVVPIGPGTAMDITARRLGKELAAKWNQTVLIVNQAPLIGHQTMASSAPDGLTIGMISATFTGGFAVRSDLRYTRDQFIGLVKFGTQDFLLWAGKHAPFNTIQEMLSYAKSNPGKLQYASPGVGAYVHLALEDLARNQNLRFLHVPYSGASFMQSVPDVAGGQVHMVITGSNPALLGQVTLGNIKVVGSFSENTLLHGKPVQSVSSVVPGVFAAQGYYGIVVSKDTPQSIKDKIEKDVISIVDSADFRKFLVDQGQQPRSMAMNSVDFDKWIDIEIAKLNKIFLAIEPSSKK